MGNDIRETLLRETERLPALFLQEALDFIRFLKTKAIRESMETALMSESALEKDWLRPEEGEAWRDL